MLPDEEKAFKALQDYYEWLLSIDQQRITENWLPLSPRNVKPSKLVIDDVAQLVDTHSDTVARGTVEKAVRLGRAVVQKEGASGPLEYSPQYLLEIIERFPGTEAQRYAKEEMDKIVRRLGDEYVGVLSSVEEHQEVSEQAETLADTPISKTEAEYGIRPPLAVTGDNPGQEASSSRRAILAGILALTIVALVAAKRFRQMGSAKSL